MTTQRIVVIRAKRYRNKLESDPMNRKALRQLKQSAAQRNMRGLKGLRFEVEQSEKFYELIAYEEIDDGQHVKKG